MATLGGTHQPPPGLVSNPASGAALPTATSATPIHIRCWQPGACAHRPKASPSSHGAATWLSPPEAPSIRQLGVSGTLGLGLSLSARSVARRRRCRTRRRHLGAALAKAVGTTSQPPILVVNLDRSVERWELCQSEFAKQGLEAERFSATYGKAMSPDELKEKATFGARYLCTPGMIGCFMSHLRIWHRVAEQGPAAVVVFEDDVLLYPGFSDRLQTLMAELPSDWDVCLLGAVGCIATDREAFHMKLFGFLTGGRRRSPGSTRSVSEHLYVPYRPAGTHAYLISQKGAQALVRLCPKPRYHVDLTAWSQPSLKLFAAKEFLATQRFGGTSTVSKGRAPVTKRFLRWTVDMVGITRMVEMGGIPNLKWAWTVACFALPVPFSTTRRRVIVELGPVASVFVLITLACLPLKSLKPLGAAFLYLASLVAVIRWLAGTQHVAPLSVLLALACICLCWG